MSRQVDNSTFEKRQGDILDYIINLGDNWLGTDTLSSSSWDVQSPLHEVSNTFDDDKATVWVSGGVIGQTYTLMNTIISSGGRTKSTPINLRIKQDNA